jgi:hypothetical protein
MIDRDFAEAPDRRTQIAVACKHLRLCEGKAGFTHEAIGLLLKVKGDVIEAQFPKSEKVSKDDGRHLVLSSDIQEWMVALITTRVPDDNPITSPEHLDNLQYHFDIVHRGHPLRHIVRNMSADKSIVGMPMAADRASADRAAIDAWFSELETNVRGFPR